MNNLEYKCLYKKALKIVNSFKEDNFQIDNIPKIELSKEQIIYIREKIQNRLVNSIYKHKLDEMIEEKIVSTFDSEIILGDLHGIHIEIDSSLFDVNGDLTDNELFNSIQINFVDTIDTFVNNFKIECMESGAPQIMDIINKRITFLSMPTPKEFVTAQAYLIITQLYHLFAIDISESLTIEKNDAEYNQVLLNNSYDVIIDEILDRAEENNLLVKVIEMINKDKFAHQDLFTNKKRFTKMKSRKHYMSFLYDCKVAPYMENTYVMVFTEFVEAYIDGCLQWINISKDPYRKKIINNDLSVLERYNKQKENENHINLLTIESQLISLPIAQQRLIPYKLLATKLGLETKQMINYLASVLEINKKTIQNNFDSIVTKPMDICIVIKS